MGKPCAYHQMNASTADQLTVSTTAAATSIVWLEVVAVLSGCAIALLLWIPSVALLLRISSVALLPISLLPVRLISCG